MRFRGMRRAIASWLDPEMRLATDRHYFLTMQLADAYRWLGEFDDIQAVVEWLRDTEANHFRKLDQAPSATKWRSQIYDFREQLRTRAPTDNSTKEG